MERDELAQQLVALWRKEPEMMLKNKVRTERRLLLHGLPSSSRMFELMNHFTEAVGLSPSTVYMQDYGGPVGFRMALAHPARIEGLIVQDAVAHNEGLGAIWKTHRAFWADRSANESALRTDLLSMQTTRTRHVASDPNVERYDRISGPMNLPSLTSPAKWIFKATSSMTTPPTSTPIPSGRHGCAKGNRGCW